MITKQKKHASRYAGLLLAVLACAMPINMSATEESCVGNGQEINMLAFRKIMIVDAGHKNMEVVLHVAEKYKMTVKGCDADNIKVEADESSVFVYTSDIDQSTVVRLDVYAPNYTEIHTAFVKSLRSADDLQSDMLHINASETPEVNLSVNARAFQFTADGSKVTLAGTCDECELTYRGFNEGNPALLEASTLQARKMHLHCGVLCDVHIHVTDMLWIATAIDSKLNVQGAPVILENGMKYSELHMWNVQ